MTTYAQSDDVLVREMDGELVLMDLQSEKYFSLNATGGAIWAAIGEGKTAEQIAEQLVTDFDADQSTAEADTMALIASLVDAGLVSTA